MHTMTLLKLFAVTFGLFIAAFILLPVIAAVITRLCGGEFGIDFTRGGIALFSGLLLLLSFLVAWRLVMNK